MSIVTSPAATPGGKRDVQSVIEGQTTLVPGTRLNEMVIWPAATENPLPVILTVSPAAPEAPAATLVAFNALMSVIGITGPATRIRRPPPVEVSARSPASGSSPTYRSPFGAQARPRALV